LRFRVQGAGCRVQDARIRVQCSGFRVQGSGFKVQGSGCRVQGAGFWVVEPKSAARVVAISELEGRLCAASRRHLQVVSLLIRL